MVCLRLIISLAHFQCEESQSPKPLLTCSRSSELRNACFLKLTRRNQPHPQPFALQGGICRASYSPFRLGCDLHSGNSCVFCLLLCFHNNLSCFGLRVISDCRQNKLAALCGRCSHLGQAGRRATSAVVPGPGQGALSRKMSLQVTGLWVSPPFSEYRSV